jgi:hypothetical protein
MDAGTSLMIRFAGQPETVSSQAIGWCLHGGRHRRARSLRYILPHRLGGTGKARSRGSGYAPQHAASPVAA